MRLPDKAGANQSNANLSSDGCHQTLPVFSSRRRRSSSRSRLYLVGSSIARVGGAIGLRIFLISSPLRGFLTLRCGMMLRREADKTHLQAGGAAAGGAAREEPIGGASRARPDARYVRRVESGAFQLISNDGAQVDKRFAGTPCLGMARSADNPSAKSLSQLSIDLEAALPDRRAHRGANIGDPRAKLDHRAYAHTGDIRQHPAPSGVHRAGDSPFRINHQYRHAVGSEYSQRDARLGCDEPVARRTELSSLARRGVHDVPMHLVQTRDSAKLRHRAAQSLPVRVDGRFFVADPIGKIHRRELTDTDAARAPDESMADCRVGPRARNRYRTGAGRCFSVRVHVKITYTSLASPKISPGAVWMFAMRR